MWIDEYCASFYNTDFGRALSDVYYVDHTDPQSGLLYDVEVKLGQLPSFWGHKAVLGFAFPFFHELFYAVNQGPGVFPCRRTDLPYQIGRAHV
jgi:hypothetical protein